MKHGTRLAWLLVTALVVFTLTACGGGSSSASPTSTPTTVNGSLLPTLEPTPGPIRSGAAGLIVPPLEGPARGAAVAKREDFRTDPNWKLPTPSSLPAPADKQDPILNPPAPSCPTGWRTLDRPTEGFHLCYPSDWNIDGQGYVASANEERWFSVGVFDFTDSTKVNQYAHVSVYVIPQYTRPFRYTIDCPQAYSVTFAYQPAVVCPSFPATSPEARIISYHVYLSNFDYFINIATYFERDSSGNLTNNVSDAGLATAVQIVDSFQFEPVAGPGITSAPTPAQSATP
jgi:hypothetical protein